MSLLIRIITFEDLFVVNCAGKDHRNYQNITLFISIQLWLRARSIRDKRMQYMKTMY